MVSYLLRLNYSYSDLGPWLSPDILLLILFWCFFLNTLSTHPHWSGISSNFTLEPTWKGWKGCGKRQLVKAQPPNAGLLEALLHRVHGNARKIWFDAPPIRRSSAGRLSWWNGMTWWFCHCFPPTIIKFGVTLGEVGIRRAASYAGLAFFLSVLICKSPLQTSLFISSLHPFWLKLRVSLPQPLIHPFRLNAAAKLLGDQRARITSAVTTSLRVSGMFTMICLSSNSFNLIVGFTLRKKTAGSASSLRSCQKFERSKWY